MVVKSRSVILKLWPAIESLGGLVKTLIAVEAAPGGTYRKWDYQWISVLHCTFLCSAVLLFFKFIFISTFHSYFSHIHNHSKMLYVYLLFICVLAKYVLFYVCISPRIFIFWFFSKFRTVEKIIQWKTIYP